jgi:hypothetical protein
MTVTVLPRAEQGPWHFPYHEADRVIIEGRQIPGLTAMADGDEVLIILDGRLSISVPERLGRQVAWLAANALAIGAGYSHLGAEQKGYPFAPLASGIGSNHHDPQ